MPNIQFNYLYRDAANYKNYGFLVFNNLEKLDLKPLENLIKSKLIDSQFFVAKNWQVPKLHFEKWDKQTDHTWHEFESVEFTSKPSNTLLKLAELVSLIENTNPFH